MSLTLARVVLSCRNASSGGSTCDLSAEEDFFSRSRVAARRAHNGRSTSALAYRSLKGGNRGDDSVASQSHGEEGDAVNESGDRVIDSAVTQPGGNQGLCGPGGLLSVPRVKPLLFLVCVVQV